MIVTFLASVKQEFKQNTHYSIPVYVNSKIHVIKSRLKTAHRMHTHVVILRIQLH